jgi:squalene-hopene/tetraprenyl-beta-curcumene cyclase
MGLLAAGQADHSAVRRGMAFLLRGQDEAGTWPAAPDGQPGWTGTGFPRVFYLHYHGYQHVFPLMALAQYAAR